MAITPSQPPHRVQPGDAVTAVGHNALVAAAEALWRSTLSRMHQGALGLHQAPDPRLAIEPAFVARITAALDGGAHAWHEQAWDQQTQKWQDLPGGRRGDGADTPAFEINGRAGVPPGTLVVMRREAEDGGGRAVFSTAAGIAEPALALHTVAGDQPDSATWHIEQQGEHRGVMPALSRIDPDSGRIFARTVCIDSLGNVIAVSAESLIGQIEGGNGPSPDEKVKVDIEDAQEGFLRRIGAEQAFHKVVGDNEVSIAANPDPPPGEGWLAKQVLVDGAGRRQLVDRHVGPAPSRYYYEFLRVMEVDLDACPEPWFNWIETRIEVDAVGHMQTAPFTGNPLEEIEP